jgi:hypothetical protein
MTSPRWLYNWGSFSFLSYFFLFSSGSLVGYLDIYDLSTGLFFFMYWCMQLHQLFIIRNSERWVLILIPLIHWLLSVLLLMNMKTIGDLAPLPVNGIFVYCIIYGIFLKWARQGQTGSGLGSSIRGGCQETKSPSVPHNGE